MNWPWPLVLLALCACVVISTQGQFHDECTQPEPTPHSETVDKATRVPLLKAIVISQPRCGSKYLLHLLSRIDSAFVLPQPLRQLQRADELQAGLPANQIPRLHELLECSYARTDADVARLIAAPACNQSITFFTDPELFNLCQKRSVSLETFNSLCRQSRVRLLDVMELPWLGLYYTDPEQDMLPIDVPIIHLVRHPAAVFKSSAQAGLYAEPVDAHSANGHPNTFLPFAQPLDTYISALCASMATNLRYIQAHTQRGKVLTVHMESLASDFDNQMERILKFLGVDYTGELSMHLRRWRESKIVSLPALFEDDVMSEMEALGSIYMNADCGQLVLDLGYSPFSFAV